MIDITGPATFADYKTLFDPCNRRRKFDPAEVGFAVPPNGGIGYRCEDCHHYFVNGPRDRRVCEIMRLPQESPVPQKGTCRFWNRDGKFPLLKVL